MYCGHSFSSEFTCVTPTEPHRLPSPVNPRSLAPHGTASILSIMARLACFFLSAANPGRAIRRLSETIIGMLLAHEPIRVLAHLFAHFRMLLQVLLQGGVFLDKFLIVHLQWILAQIFSNLRMRVEKT